MIAYWYGVIAHAIQPIHNVFTAITTRRSRGSTHAQMHGTTCQVEILSDLTTRLAIADDQHGTIRECLGVAVGPCIQLLYRCW